MASNYPPGVSIMDPHFRTDTCPNCGSEEVDSAGGYDDSRGVGVPSYKVCHDCNHQWDHG